MPESIFAQPFLVFCGLTPPLPIAILASCKLAEAISVGRRRPAGRHNKRTSQTKKCGS